MATMKLADALGLGENGVVSIVGGGGKTSVMFRLAAELPSKYRVLITTTTKIYPPSREKHPCFCIKEKDFSKEDLICCLQAGERPVLGSEITPQHNKLNGVEPDFLAQLQGEGLVDFILIEADGSKGRPLKGHRALEPVIPAITTQLVIVIGADIFGKRLDSEYVHCPEIVADLTGQRLGTPIQPEIIARLITHPQGIMATSPPGAEKLVIINKMDCLQSQEPAYETARHLLHAGISKVILCSVQSPDPVIDIIAH